MLEVAIVGLVICAQRRYAEAEVVTDAALDETQSGNKQGPLLRVRARFKHIAPFLLLFRHNDVCLLKYK
jgi:hypothetical protein